jgi:peptidase E
MTKYILQSGNVSAYPEKLKKYNEEVFRDFLSGGKNEKSEDEPVKVLFNFFSQKREDWEVKYKNYDKHLKESVNLKLETKMAMPDEFVEQCQWADVIIIAGGDDELLQHWMLKFNIPKIWEGRVVTGGSAGADFLVNSFYIADWRTVKEGLGIFPIKFIPHYKSDFGKDDPRGPVDWQRAYEELENYGDKSLPIYALEEGDFVIFEK